jgi:hypothetical protein
LEAGAILGSLGLGAILGLQDTEDIIRAGVTGVAKVILELQEIKVFQGFRRAKVILGFRRTKELFPGFQQMNSSFPESQRVKAIQGFRRVKAILGSMGTSDKGRTLGLLVIGSLLLLAKLIKR